MDKSGSNRVKCRFCDWSTVKAYSKGGKFYGPVQAQQRLIDHIFLEHPDVAEEMQARLDEHFGDKGK